MHPQVQELLNRPQPEQRSEEWYLARKGRITASAVASLLTRTKECCESYVKEFHLEDTFEYDNRCCNPYSSKRQFTLDKCKSRFTASQATVWGCKYESVAIDIYSKNHGVKVIEFGLLAHKDLDYIGASPDGITEDGIMIEIKCPFRRKITGITPLYYWQQVQIQLEVCDLEYCDFVEYEFTEVASLAEFINDELFDEPPEEKGLFIQIEDVPDNFNNRSYIYPDKKYLNKVSSLNKWATLKIEQIIDENELTVYQNHENYVSCMDTNYKKINIRTVYWKVFLKSIYRIKRDREWFATVNPILKREWDEVVHYRDHIYPNENAHDFE